MTQLSQGQVLGRYELLLPVARGGMAEVWAARLHGTRGFRKIVAIKTILPGAIDSQRMEQMFLAEAELASRIEHPNVIQTLELGEQGGLLYFVLEWLDGESLSALLAQAGAHGGIPLAIAVNIIGQACKGLHAAHELKDASGKLLGVVHRDISPQNILVGFSGTVKIVDFGIAKATQNACTLTEAGEVKGKLAYMAPEQLRGAANVDRRADVFSMGTLLYALTTGRHPFRGDHPGATLTNITTRVSVAPPSAQIEDYPADLEAVVLKALKKSPADRFASAFEMLQALERAMPDALGRSYDLKVADFVTRLAGTGVHRRQSQIRQAGELLDQIRGKSGASLEATSPSSLSALAIDGGARVNHSLSMLAAAAAASEQSALQAKRSRGKLWAMAIGAVVAGTTLGLTLAGGGKHESEASSASVAPLSPGSSSWLSEPSTSPPPVVVGVRADAASAPAVSASARPAAPEQASVAAERVAKPASVRQRWTPKPSPPQPPVTVVAPAPVETAPSKPKRDAQPPGAQQADAWNPDSFGARQ